MSQSSSRSGSKAFLSKSRFKLALECPAKLNYTGRKDYVNQNDTNDMLKGLAEGGHQIGKLAQWIYSKDAAERRIPYFEITASDWQEQIKQTEGYLQHDNVVLFEPTFVVDHFLVRVDVLVKNGNHVQLIEVKSKSFDSKKSTFPRDDKRVVRSEYLPYLQDVAFQTMVVRLAQPTWQISSALMMPDKAFNTSTPNLHELFKVTLQPALGGRTQVEVAMPALTIAIDHQFLQCINVDTEVEALINGTLTTTSQSQKIASIGDAAQWADLYAAQTLITAELHPTRCGNCEFYCDQPTDELRSGFHECWLRAKVPGFTTETKREETVLGLYNDRVVKGKVMKSGKYLLSDLHEDDLGQVDTSSADEAKIANNQRQFMQVFGTPDGNPSFFKRKLFEERRKSWQYPYYFLDFEGATSALPVRAGHRPNQQIVFQYSIHRLHENGALEHYKHYLDTSNSGEPHLRLLRQLKADLDTNGTIFRWHNYENTVLNALYRELQGHKNPPEDQQQLLTFVAEITNDGERHMVDMAALAADCYFHSDTRGSSSIKAVLPAIMNDSSFLQDTYSQPIYGGDSGSIPSLNYQSGDGITWWQTEPSNQNRALDPYEILKNLTQSKTVSAADGEVLKDSEENAEKADIANGGAALMAYIRIQSGGYTPQQKAALENAMLRYCELDTLAMAMIMQAWLDR